MLTIGIDPGWKSFGIAIRDNDVNSLIAVKDFVPAEYKSIGKFIDELAGWVNRIINTVGLTYDCISAVFVERFVTYGNVMSDPEDILKLIGALEYWFYNRRVVTRYVRAIDWKVKVVHHLYKTTGIPNPHKSLDKKFSAWAAKLLSDEEPSSSHMADAICISYLSEEILNGGKS